MEKGNLKKYFIKLFPDISLWEKQYSVTIPTANALEVLHSAVESPCKKQGPGKGILSYKKNKTIPCCFYIGESSDK